MSTASPPITFARLLKAFCLEGRAQDDHCTRGDTTAGTYSVTLKCEGEAFPESHRAHLMVGFKPGSKCE